MEPEGDFEVLLKKEPFGKLTLVIKRKKERQDDLTLTPSTTSGESCSEIEEDEVFANSLFSESKLERENPMVAFYNRPNESYESLIKMAFKDLSEEERREGLPAHDIAQWICRKFPYFATIKSLLQCVNYRLSTSNLFEKYRIGKKIRWKWNGNECGEEAKNLDLIEAAAVRGIRRKRIRKKPNFFSIDWKLDDRKKRKFSDQDVFTQYSPLFFSPKRETLEVEEDKKLRAHLDFLKSSKVFILPCSPEKPTATKQINIKKKVFVDPDQEKLLLYLGLVSIESIYSSDGFLDYDSSEDNAINSSSPFEDDCLPTARVKSSTRTTRLDPREIDVSKNNVASSTCDSLKSLSHDNERSFSNPLLSVKKSNSFPSLAKNFGSSAYPPPETVRCNPVKIEKSSERFFDKFSKIKKQKLNKALKKQVKNKQNSKIQKDFPCIQRMPIVLTEYSCKHCDQLETIEKPRNCRIVPGDNGSPLFPTITSIFSMRKRSTPQKHHPPVDAFQGLSHFSTEYSHAWNKFYISSPVMPRNAIPGAFAGQHIRPCFIPTPAPQIRGCFVRPPVVLFNTQPSRSVSMESFVCTTWSRNVTQTVMTTTVPNRCLVYRFA